MSKEILGGVIITNADDTIIHEARQHEQKQYASFEKAIDAWENRTGLFVERTHKVGHVWEKDGKKITTNEGSQWRNFSKFLGSKEAIAYREENAMRLEDMVKEFMELGIKELDMEVKEP